LFSSQPIQKKANAYALDERVGGRKEYYSLFGWLVADGWCWFVLRE
jgi:hypothetical protein